MCDFHELAFITDVDMVIGRGVHKLFQLWKFTAFQRGMSFSNLGKVDVAMFSNFITLNMVKVQMVIEMKTSKTHKQFLTMLIQSKLSSGLVNTGSSVSLVSCTFLKSLVVSGTKEVCKGKNSQGNNTPMPSKEEAKKFSIRNHLHPIFVLHS